MQPSLRTGAAGLVVACWPAGVLAHGFAVRYDLPIPLGFYLAGAGATVALSFLLLALFARANPARPERAPAQLVCPRAGRILASPWIARPLQGISLALFLLVVAAALFGDTYSLKNISPVFVWVIWWVGMMFVNTFIGDLWALVNPWSIVFAGAESLVRRARPGARLSRERPYPERLGVWPAVVLFLTFAWLELIWGEGESPRQLALVIIGYSLLTWTGMFAFGRRVWLAHGEAFAVVFSTFARFAPAELRAGDLVLRPPGAGLLARDPVPVSMVALVLALLATVTFDGFLSTPVWTGIHDYFAGLPGLAALWNAPWMTVALKFWLLQTPLFLLFPLAFAAAFLACCRLTAAIGRGAATGEVARSFVLTLLPIAIAYHLAHYLLYLLLTGQYVIAAVSDPFGFGWDLFGTASYKPDIGLVGAEFAWYTGVIAIVTGHVIAVYLAHRTALRLYPDGRRVLASQLPMLVLMVGYTMLSLWIIAQPAVR